MQSLQVNSLLNVNKLSPTKQIEHQGELRSIINQFEEVTKGQHRNYFNNINSQSSPVIHQSYPNRYNPPSLVEQPAHIPKTNELLDKSSTKIFEIDTFRMLFAKMGLNYDLDVPFKIK